MKSINLRFCLILVIILVVVAGAVHAIHAIQVSRHGSFFLDQAEAAVEKEDFQDAVSNYNRYLNLEPNDPDVVAKLGIVLADHGSAERAYKTLEKAIRLDPDRDDVRRRLVEVTLRMNRHRDARAHLDHLLKAAPDDPELLGYLGRCQIADQDYLDAAESFKKAIAKNPQEIDNYLLLIALLTQFPDDFRNQASEETSADTWLDRMVEANPDSDLAFFARAQYRFGQGKFEETLTDARKSVELEPEASRAMLLAAECLIRLKRPDEARQLAEGALEIAPQDPLAYSTLADLELSQTRTQEAVRWLQQGVKAVESRSTLPLQLIRLLLGLEQIDEAEQVVVAIESKDYPLPIVEFFKARIDFGRGLWQEAKQRLTATRAEVTALRGLSHEVEFWLGKTYEQLGDNQEALKAYRQSTSIAPTYAAAREALAQLLGRLGRHDEAAEELRILAGMQGNTVAAQLQLARQRLLKNVSLPAAQRDWTAVEQSLNSLKTATEATKDALRVSLLEAEMLAVRNRAEEAEQVLLAARDRHPQEAAVWAGLVQMADRRGDREQAARWLDEASQSAGDSVVLRLAKATHLLAAPEPPDDLSNELVALAANTEEFDASQRLLLWRNLIRAALGANQAQPAEEIAKTALGTAANDLLLEELAFRTALQLKDPQLVASRLDRIRDTEGTGPLWHYAQALWLLQRSDEATPEELEEAGKHLAEAKKTRPEWASVPLLEAAIRDQQGDAAAACQSYLQAIELGAADTQVIRRAVEMLYSQEQFSQAGELLRKLESQPQLATEESDRLKSQILGRLDQLDEALEPARRVADTSEDYRDHLWLGQILAMLGFRQRASGQELQAEEFLSQAEAAMRRAQELDPAAPGPWIALIQVFVRSDRREDAERVMKELADSATAENSPRALADGYILLGEQEKAAEHLITALKKSSNNVALIRTMADFCVRTGRPQPAEVADGLQAIVDGKIEATSEDVASCRRFLALALKNRGSFSDLQEALKLIDANLVADPQSILDRRTKAVLLAGHPQRAKRQQAVEILEELVGSSDSNEETRLLLVNLYASEGRWELATPHLRVMSSPQALRIYANHLIQIDALNEAELRVRRLEQLAPDDFATFALATQLRFRRGDFDPVLEDITKRQDKPSENAETLPLVNLLNGFAERLDASDANSLASQFREKAGVLLHQFAEKDPKSQPSQVVLLWARSGNWGEALDALENAVPDLPASEFGQLASALANQFKGNSEALRRLESVLQTALATHGRVVPLLQAMVWVSDAQQQYINVETLYRKILEIEPNNVVAMNNLAEMLALSKREPREALELVERAIAVAGPISAFLDTRATVYRALGQPAKAIRDMQTVIVEKQQPTALVRLAMAYAQAGDLSHAAQAVSQARALDFDKEQLHPLEQDAYEVLVQQIR